MMNENMNKTAAEDYRAGIRGLIDACNRMQLLGANQAAVADAALAAHYATAAFKDLVDKLADGNNRYCVNCRHQVTAVTYATAGNDLAQHHECGHPNKRECPLVQACGLGHNGFDVPAFLQRQGA